MKNWIGIDVPKSSLDAGWIEKDSKRHLKVSNTLDGFKQLIQKVPSESQFVMEATGTYYLNVALFLHDAGFHVSVENPVRIKNHMKTNLTRSKTDKPDAFSICLFGHEKNPTAWKPLSKEVAQMQQLCAFTVRLAKQILQLSNQLHAFSQSVLVCPDVSNSIRSIIKKLRSEKLKAEKRLVEISESQFKRELEIMTSVPGMGPMTASRIMATIGDFSRFQTSRQLVCFLGLSPMLHQSGTSINKNGAMSRMGGSNIRGPLYLCAMSAMRFNPSCKNMYARMKKNQKPGKVIAVAIMNKLVRQIFSIVKNNRLYDPDFCV